MSETGNIALNVQGMTCEGCVAAVTRVIKKTDPQANVRVTLASGDVEIDSAADAAALIAVIEKAGYAATAR